MPSVAQESPAVHPSKKRRRDDGSLPVPSYAGLLATSSLPSANRPTLSSHGILTEKGFDPDVLFSPRHYHPLAAARKIIPLPPGKRQRTTWDDRDAGTEEDVMQRSSPNSPLRGHRVHHGQQQPSSRGLFRQESRGSPRPAAPAVATAAPPPSNSSTLMGRCHICFRRPNKKSDLDSFADCQGCGQRTCYVCMRECLGWGPTIETQATRLDPTATPTTDEGDTSFTMVDADTEHQPSAPAPELDNLGHEQGWTRGGGHRQMVCSRCCVEKGQDGDVVCLGCLPFVEG